MVFPLLELLSDRRLVEIQTSCSLLRGLLTPCYLFSVLDQKTKWHRTSVFSKNKKPQTTPCYNSWKAKAFHMEYCNKFIFASDTSSQSYPYLLLGMKKCVKVFDSTFSIYHTFCFTTFVSSSTIRFFLKHNRLFSGGNINCFNCLEFHTLCRCERHQWLFLQVVYISVVKHH